MSCVYTDGPVHESCTSSVLDLVDNLDNEDQAFFMDNTTLAANSDSDSEAQVEQVSYTHTCMARLIISTPRQHISFNVHIRE